MPRGIGDGKYSIRSMKEWRIARIQVLNPAG
jgi:hypothetical protein